MQIFCYVYLTCICEFTNIVLIKVFVFVKFPTKIMWHMAISKLHNNNINLYNTVYSKIILFKGSSPFWHLNTTSINYYYKTFVFVKFPTKIMWHMAISKLHNNNMHSTYITLYIQKEYCSKVVPLFDIEYVDKVIIIKHKINII